MQLEFRLTICLLDPTKCHQSKGMFHIYKFFWIYTGLFANAVVTRGPLSQNIYNFTFTEYKRQDNKSGFESVQHDISCLIPLHMDKCVKQADCYLIKGNV